LRHIYVHIDHAGHNGPPDYCILITVISLFAQNLVEILLKSIDIAISGHFVKYQRHRGTRLQNYKVKLL